MNRRRFLKLAGIAATGLTLSNRSLASTDLTLLKHRGFALGAEGCFSLYSTDKRKANEDLRMCFQEIQRLEKVFSLYDSGSELSQLNRQGYLNHPSTDWLAVLDVVSKVNEITQGLFDPTVQSYWEAQRSEVSFDKITRSLIGWNKVDYSHDRIGFSMEGMGITLNGIVQGYITDRLTEILKNLGYEHALVEMGETRSIGIHPEDRPWRVAIRDFKSPSSFLQTVSLENGSALATSGNYEKISGKAHHFLPSSGSTTTQWSSLSVKGKSAMEVDALSTGLMFAPQGLLESIRNKRSDLEIFRLL